MDQETLKERRKAFLKRVEFRPVDDPLPACVLEASSFPPEEAASLKAITYRMEHAPELMLGAYHDTRPAGTLPLCGTVLIGYIAATAVKAEVFTKESMATHDPAGNMVCVHSVCVDMDWRGRGIAKAMLERYIEGLRKLRADGAPYTTVSLLAHEDLVPFYDRFGFISHGVSAIVHGPRHWVEMYYALD